MLCILIATEKDTDSLVVISVVLMGTLIRESLSSHHPCVKELRTWHWCGVPLRPQETPLRPTYRKIESVCSGCVAHPPGGKIAVRVSWLSEYVHFQW